MAMLNPPRWLQSPVGACLLYGGISIALTFFNKGIFSYYHFKHPVRPTLACPDAAVSPIAAISAQRSHVRRSVLTAAASSRVQVFMIVTQICFSLLFSLAFRALGVISFPIERRHLRGCVVLATVWCVWLSALRPVPGLADTNY